MPCPSCVDIAGRIKALRHLSNLPPGATGLVSCMDCGSKYAVKNGAARPANAEEEQMIARMDAQLQTLRMIAAERIKARLN